MAIITEEKMKNLDRDIKDIGEANNEDKVINPRYGQPFKSLPMLSRLFEAMIATGYLTINDLQTAIDIALEAGAGANGWTADLIAYGGSNQKVFNDEQKLKNAQVVNLDDFKRSTNTDTDAINLMFEYVKAHPEIKEMNITRDISVSERIWMQQDASKWLNGKVLNAENINIHYTGNGADSLYVAILQVTGSLTTVTTTATVDYPEYTSDLTVADASIFAVGDYILIRSTSLEKPDIYLNHMVRIEDIAGNVLKTDTVRRLAVRPSVAAVNVTKVNNVDGFKIKGRPTFTAENQNTRSNGIGGVILTQCTNSYADVQSKGLWFKTLVLNNCHRSIGIAQNSDAVAKGGGEGYALQLLYSVYCTGRDCFGNNLRHTTDATASWHCTFENNRDVGASSGSFIHHAAYEYNIKYFNCHSVNSKTNGFAFGTVTGAFGDTSSEIEVNNCTTENSALDCIVFANKGKGLKIIGGAHGSSGNGYSVNTSNNDTSITDSNLRTGLLISSSADMATDGFAELNNSKVASGTNTRALNITANRQLKINGGEINGRWTLADGVVIRDVGADIITPDASSLITLVSGINNQHWYKDGGRLILNATVSVSQVYQAAIIDFNDVTFVQNNPNIVQSFNGTTVRLKNNKGAARVAFNGNSVASLDLFGNTLSGLLTFNLFTLNNFTQDVRIKGNTLTTSGTGNTVNVDNTNTIPMLHLNDNSLIGNVNIPNAQVTKCIATLNTIKGVSVLPTNNGTSKIVANNIVY
ncbi:hypothetical protein NRA40_10465 [Acinetobacter baumannii]|nr:hypothetical protein [Acinetobacter baumannii]